LSDGKKNEMITGILLVSITRSGWIQVETKLHTDLLVYTSK